jgi:hypothetical protein
MKNPQGDIIPNYGLVLGRIPKEISEATFLSILPESDPKFTPMAFKGTYSIHYSIILAFS